MTMTITVIYGPMFAGKSSTLINKARKYESVRGSSALCMIKHARDTRYDENPAKAGFDPAEAGFSTGTSVVSHDGVRYPAVAVSHLMSITDDQLSQVSRVFIDEGQFFPDLIEFIKYAQSKNISVVIAGLDLNHKKENFGHMMEAIQLSTKSIRLQARCVDCRGLAVYTRMKSQSSELRNAEIVVGGQELYSPVCPRCYEESP